MPFFQRHPPNAIYHGAILLGCLAFLVGVSGIFYFHRLDARSLPPRDTASVLVHGVENDPDIEVVAKWTPLGMGSPREASSQGTGPDGRLAETGRLGEDPGVYLFQHAPEGVPLELIVYRRKTGGRVELHRQLAVLTYGQSFYTAVPSGLLEGAGSGSPKVR